MSKHIENHKIPHLQRYGQLQAVDLLGFGASAKAILGAPVCGRVSF